jgi:hypothetical protein
MALPRPGQLEYLADLITAVADAEGTTPEEIKISVGLLERTPWGVSPTHRALTRASVSGLLTRLHARLAATVPPSDVS